MASDKKLCKDCRHFDANNGNCRNLRNADPGDGLPSIGARMLRRRTHLCGSEGKWFEPKEQE